MEEIWKDVPNCPDYQVSNLGRVKSFKLKKETIMKPETIKDGYQRISLKVDGKRKHFLVHRLVLMAFNPVENMEALQVNHKDENSQNNKLENLEWCTAKYNNNYGNHKQHVIESNKIANPNKISIVCVETKQEFISIHEAARQLNLNQSAISNVINGKTKTVGGLHFLTVQKYNQMSDEDIEKFLKENPAFQPIKSQIQCVETQQIFKSAAEAAAILNIDSSSICKVLNGKRKTCGGFHFIRITENKEGQICL